MELNWIKGRGDISESQIDIFENDYRITLPQKYKELVLGFNGGYPNKNIFVIESGREGVFESLLNWDKNRKANIYFWMKTVDIKNLIPFAKDPFGNLICFSYEENEVPKIVFWDHELNKLYFIAEDFETFLASLAS